MTPDQIMAEFRKEYPTPFPRKALEVAGEKQSEMTPLFIAYIEELLACKGELPEGKIQGFAFVFHLLAEWRETQAYRPIIEILRLPDEKLDLLLGDAITATAWQVVYSIFDGDFDPIISLLEDENAYEFTRSAMFQALTAIVIKSPIHRPKVLSILENFYEKFGAEKHVDDNYTWVGWVNTISDIGASELYDRVKKVFDAGGIGSQVMHWENFEEALEYGTGQKDAPSYWMSDYDNPLFGSAIDELSKWYCYSKEAIKMEVEAIQLEKLREKEQLFDEIKKVGRNEPCPCGSGKKFKKCCLH